MVYTRVELFSKPCLTLVSTWTVIRQAPLSMGFPRQEYCGGLPFSPPRDLPKSGIEPMIPKLQADSLPLSHQGSLSQVSLGKKPMYTRVVRNYLLSIFCFCFSTVNTKHFWKRLEN